MHVLTFFGYLPRFIWVSQVYLQQFLVVLPVVFLMVLGGCSHIIDIYSFFFMGRIFIFRLPLNRGGELVLFDFLGGHEIAFDGYTWSGYGDLMFLISTIYTIFMHNIFQFPREAIPCYKLIYYDIQRYHLIFSMPKQRYTTYCNPQSCLVKLW